LRAAAPALGLCHPVLHGQIARLENELGGPLVTRAERGHAMTWTDLGIQILHAWNTWTARSAGDRQSM
jgi:DNA-binding transcriptional LysR family regulator